MKNKVNTRTMKVGDKVKYPSIGEEVTILSKYSVSKDGDKYLTSPAWWVECGHGWKFPASQSSLK